MPYRRQSSAEDGDQRGDPICEYLRGIAQSESLETFCSEWLSLQCHVIEGVRDATLVLGDVEKKSFAPAASWPPGKSLSRQLIQVAERSLSRDERLVIRPDNGSPNGWLSMAHPIHVARALCGVVAFDLEEREDAEMQSVFRRLDTSCAWIEGLIARSRNGKNRAAEAPAAPAAHLGLRLTLDLLATILQHDRVDAAGLAFVTELATRFDCDRVVLGFGNRRRRIRLHSMSHSSRFDKKSNLARAIERAMEEAMDQEATVRYPQADKVSSSDFRITEAHSELAREHGNASICSIPLSKDGEVVGVLTAEKPDGGSFDAATVEMLESICDAAGPVLGLKRRDERSLPGVVEESFRGFLKGLLGPGHPYWKLAFLVLFALTLFVSLYTGDYRVSATTVLEGSIQRAAVAPFNGYIAEASKRAGDTVREGDVLCILDERNLRLEEQKWTSQLEKLRKQHQQALAKRADADFEIISAQISQATAQLALIDDQVSRTRVTAPFDGVIVSGDLSQSIGAPVERGDPLFEIAPLHRYRVILEVDERDIGHLEVGQQGQLLLSALPTDRMPLTVSKITPVSLSNEGRNYFRVEAELQGDLDLRLRPGMEGVGKVHVGRRSLIWIWTHTAIDWVRLTLWSWLP